MADADFYLGEWDTAPVLEIVCRGPRTDADPDGPIINLTGATAIFQMRAEDDLTALITKAADVVSPGTLGKVQFTWDGYRAGRYEGRLKVTLASGAKLSFPNHRQYRIEVTPDPNADPEPPPAPAPSVYTAQAALIAALMTQVAALEVEAAANATAAAAATANVADDLDDVAEDVANHDSADAIAFAAQASATAALSTTVGTNSTAIAALQSAVSSGFRVANVAAMKALSMTGRTTSRSYLCAVESVGDLWLFVPAGALALESMVVVASNDLAGQWMRLGIRNPFWLTKQDWWAVDPVFGSDEAIGWGTSRAEAQSRPVKTFREIYRRWHSGTIVTPRISLMGDMLFTDSTIPPASLVATVGVAAEYGITICGVSNLIHSGGLTGVRNRTDFAGRGKYVLEDTGYSFGGVTQALGGLPHQIRRTGGLCQAEVLTRETATSISISSPNASDPAGIFPAGGRANFAAADPYELVRAPLIYDLGSAPQCRVCYVNVILNSDGYYVRQSYGDVRVALFSSIAAIKHTGRFVGYGVGFHATASFYGGYSSLVQWWVAGSSYSPKTMVDVFSGCVMGVSDGTCQNGTVAARYRGTVRFSDSVSFQDMVPTSQVDAGCFHTDNDGLILIDPDLTLSGHSIADWSLFNEEPMGRIYGASAGKFANFDYVAPFDVNQVVAAAEVGTPINYRLTDLPIADFSKGTLIVNGYE